MKAEQGDWVSGVELYKVAAMTGAGQYYCAGNDLSGFQKLAAEFNGDLQKGAQQGGIILEKYVSSYIDFSKPLVGLINGPAVGISVTVLGMFDLVLASSNATFHTPFPSLGQSPEGCSSYTFPLLMGHQRAVEMLVCEKKISAEEALERNLVTEVIPHENFHKVCQERLALLASLPPKSVMYGKALMRQQHKEKLHEVNKAECDRLVERWTSEECISAVMKFLSRKQSKMWCLWIITLVSKTHFSINVLGVSKRSHISNLPLRTICNLDQLFREERNWSYNIKWDSSVTEVLLKCNIFKTLKPILLVL